MVSLNLAHQGIDFLSSQVNSGHGADYVRMTDYAIRKSG